MSELMKPVRAFTSVTQDGELSKFTVARSGVDGSVPVVILTAETYDAMVDALNLAHENHGENPLYTAALDAAGALRDALKETEK